ncbi:hypothetical protein KI387_026342, partial [Taxus chinensis]
MHLGEKGALSSSASRAQLQASVTSVLPPFPLGAARHVLVGDPQHCPATVISQAAGMLQYSRSFFFGVLPTSRLSNYNVICSVSTASSIRDSPS